MEKKEINKFGKHRLLFEKDNIKYYLKKHSWDCDWYWGKGYIVTYSNEKQPERSVDTSSHEHLKGYFTSLSSIEENSITLSNKERWEFLECMQTANALCEMMEIYNRGGAHMTTNPFKDKLKSNEKYLELKDLAEEQLNYAWELLKP